MHKPKNEDTALTALGNPRYLTAPSDLNNKTRLAPPSHDPRRLAAKQIQNYFPLSCQPH